MTLKSFTSSTGFEDLISPVDLGGWNWVSLSFSHCTQRAPFFREVLATSGDERLGSPTGLSLLVGHFKTSQTDEGWCTSNVNNFRKIIPHYITIIRKVGKGTIVISACAHKNECSAGGHSWSNQWPDRVWSDTDLGVNIELNVCQTISIACDVSLQEKYYDVWIFDLAFGSLT